MSTVYDNDREKSTLKEKSQLAVDRKENNMEIKDNRKLARIQDLPTGALFMEEDHEICMKTNAIVEAKGVAKVIEVEGGFLFNKKTTDVVNVINGTFYIEDVEKKMVKAKDAPSGCFFLNENNDLCVFTDNIIWKRWTEFDDRTAIAIVLKTGETLEVSATMKVKQVSVKLYIED